MAEVCAESPRDSGAVYAVNRVTLGGPDEAALVDALREAGAPFVSMVAAKDGMVVGHIRRLCRT